MNPKYNKKSNIFLKIISHHLIDLKKKNNEKTLMIGISGAPGAGKTTLTNTLKGILKKSINNDQIIIVSIDDFYYTRKEEKVLGISKWKPSTHDLKFAQKLKQLKQSNAKSKIELPIFDKRKRDRSQKKNIIEGNVSFVFFEGFGVGLNSAGYSEFSQYIDYLILLQADLDMCKKWRCDAGWKSRRNFNYEKRQDFNESFKKIWSDLLKQYKCIMPEIKSNTDLIIKLGKNHNLKNIYFTKQKVKN